MFLDETSATTNMTRPLGRCARGLRLWPRYPTVTGKPPPLSPACGPPASLPLTSSMAPWGRHLPGYVEQILVPTLGPGDIVVMDNLPCHKVAGIQEAIESRQARLLDLPPYSPDLIYRAGLRRTQGELSQRPASGPATASGMPLDISSSSTSQNERRNLFRIQAIQPDR